MITGTNSYFNNWYECTNLNGDNNNIRKLVLTTLRNIHYRKVYEQNGTMFYRDVSNFFHFQFVHLY